MEYGQWRDTMYLFEVDQLIQLHPHTLQKTEMREKCRSHS